MNFIKKRKFLLPCFFLLYIVLTAFIFKNSAKDAEISTKQSASYVSLAKVIIGLIWHGEISDFFVTVIVRKLAHFAEYAMQGFFLSGALLALNKNKFYPVYVLFSGLLTACIDEYIQTFFVGRSGEISDIFIDFAGCIAVTVCYMCVYLILKRKAVK